MARRFRFGLEAVGKVRREAERSRQRDLADAVREVLRLDQELAGWQQQMEALATAAREMEAEGLLDVVLLRRRQAHRIWIKSRLAGVQSAREEAAEQVEQQRRGLVEASKQRKVIDKLRERKRTLHLVQERREQQTIADEAAVQRFIRNTNTGAVVGAWSE